MWAGRAVSVSDDCRDLGAVKSFPDNSVAFLTCVPAFVVHGVGSDFSVYLAVAPQDSREPLRWDNRRHVFFSAVHGESFNLMGEPVAAAGDRGLLRCPIEIVGGRLLLLAPGTSPTDIRQACG